MRSDAVRVCAPAPYFHVSVLRSSGTVGVAFNDWVRHYNECAACRRDDWYAPWAGLLCAEGRKLFRIWAWVTRGD